MNNQEEKTPRRRRPRRVLVLGAGMSGLSCARELQQRNYQVLVLEARGRVGGRLKGEELQVASTAADSIKTRNDKPKTVAVDLGGALIHGIDENPLYKLTRELRIPALSVSDCLLMNDGGWPIDPKEDDRISTIFNECLEESFRRIQDGTTTLENQQQTRTTRSHQNSPSFGDLFAQVCKEKGVPMQHALMKWHQANLEVSCGAGFDRLGWEWNEDEPYGFDGAHVALGPSWKAVVENLAEPLEIVYRAQVQRIQILEPPPAPRPAKKAKTSTTAAKGATTTSRTTSISPPPEPTRQSRRLRGQDASVRRSNRTNKAVERFTVEHSLPNSDTTSKPAPPPGAVQVTVQLGDPNSSNNEPLTLQADAVVCTLPLGILQEGSVEFDPPLSAEKQRAIRSLGTGLLNKCALTFEQVFWQDSDFLGLAENANSSYLVLNLAKSTGQPVLVFMYGGNFAASIQDWTDAEIVQDCLAVLRKLCVPKIPPVLDYTVTRWGHEQYSRMAFTYIPPGVDGFAALSAAREPVLDEDGVPILMFAGEHTTPFHPSTIHGAYLSGIREAYRLDCAVDAEALGNLRFSEEELYQRTFAVGDAVPEDEQDGIDGKQEATKTTADEGASSVRPRPQHRRRGASEVMKMRSPNSTTVADNPNGSNGSGPKSPITTPTRRSQRAVQITVDPESSDDETGDTTTEDHAKFLKSLEERSISRSFESYGPDFDYIHKCAIPVHGGRRDSLGPRRTVAQVQSQCQKLARKRVKAPSIARSWIAKTTSEKKTTGRTRKSR